jgi:hypothetical protein
MSRTCILLAEWMAMLCLVLASRGTAGTFHEDVEFAFGDDTGAWTSSELTYQSESLLDLPFISDDNVAPAQMLTPQRRLGLQTAQRPQQTQEQRRESGLASVPFMIGDTSAGSCISFTGLLEVDLAHPTMACGRLNVSEGNTPLPTDRLYLSYRHFENATATRFFQYRQDFNIDQYTLGGEKTFFNDMLSFEMRLPLEHRLTSQPFTYDVLNPPFFLDPVAFPPGFTPMGGGTRTELGNVSFLFKALLVERADYAVSAGIGVTLPTAQDIEYLVTTDDTLVFPSIPGLTADSSVLLDVFVSNETVYIAPFTAWLWQPAPRFFHQGFFQVEVAANPSSVVVAGDGLNDFYFNNVFIGTLDWRTPFPTGRTNLHAQTLMRLNLGCGYVLMDNPRADFLRQLTTMFEMHYTSTLNDANTSSVPVFVEGSLGSIPVQSLDFGNRHNRVDIVNAVAGVSARVGNWVVTNGVAAPLKECSCSRGFDFEYNLQMQRPF